ncbi:hypothetical protein [Micromonospora sp. HM5-17]|jgi:hypothetical protein|uniref:hypothetical protein n=1 Tax=Micromonospora sp. HM5-17 TaxID=2487710 RepID=UPI0018F42D20|nr:hypothetical protein [Micromonospora sp. HM5-17]
MTGRYVVHVPFTAPDEPAARQFARIAARMVGMLPGANDMAATVSELDDQRLQFRLFCGRFVGGGRRCERPIAHPPPCTTIEPAPPREAVR